MCEEVLPQLRRARDAVGRGEPSSGQCMEKAEFHVAVQTVSAALKEPSMLDLLLEHLAESGEVNYHCSVFFGHPIDKLSVFRLWMLAFVW